jgi:predicted RNase H-related nuclease YkuK (DUF458 family)
MMSAEGKTIRQVLIFEITGGFISTGIEVPEQKKPSSFSQESIAHRAGNKQ